MAPSVIGIAGRPLTAQERSYVKQAVFLLRFRIKFDGVQAGALPPRAPDVFPVESPADE